MVGNDTGTILIRGARQLLTLRGERTPRCGAQLNNLSIIHDGALLVRDGVLQEVGTTRRVENLKDARRAVEVNAAGRVVIPGFVDSHTHLPFPMPGLSEAYQAAAARLVRANSGKRLGARLRAYVEAMARHGTTTVEAQTGCGMDERAESKLLRVLSALKCAPIDLVPTFLCRLPAHHLDGAAALEAVDRVLNTWLPKIQKRRLTGFADLLCDGEADHHPWFSRFLHGARQMGFVCRIHAAPAASLQAIALAEEGHVLSISHLAEIPQNALERLAATGAIATLLPCYALRHGAEWPPARALIEAGIPVALATDFNPLHTPTLNMQTAVALGAMNLGMTVAEAISAATINGAHVAGCAARAGSLEVGKSADLAILNISDYRDLAHHFGTNLVHLTMKRGGFIYQEGKVAPFDVEDLISA